MTPKKDWSTMMDVTNEDNRYEAARKELDILIQQADLSEDAKHLFNTMAEAAWDCSWFSEYFGDEGWFGE